MRKEGSIRATRANKNGLRRRRTLLDDEEALLTLVRGLEVEKFSKSSEN